MSPPETNILYKGKFLQVKKEGRWEFVDRTNSSGVVAILAITNDRQLVLVEQFRIPVNRRVIELPAGLVDNLDGQKHEGLKFAARRELLEETGYESNEMEFLAEGPPSAGLVTEVVHFFRAAGLQKTAGGGGIDSEAIQVHLVPLLDLKNWIKQKQTMGCLIDYKIYAALYLNE